MARYKDTGFDTVIDLKITGRCVLKTSSEIVDYRATGGIIDPADIPDPMVEIRTERARRMSIADMEINKLDDNVGDSSAMRLYRQKLRDVPQNQPKANINTIVWPAV